MFKQQMRESLRQEAKQCRAVALAKHANAYASGDQDDSVYFIESRQIKLLMLSPDGRECLLALLTEGDIFGELCFSGMRERSESAIAMEMTYRAYAATATACPRLLRWRHVYSRRCSFTTGALRAALAPVGIDP
jgi:CRP-like cAMP-binding protein